MSNLLFNYDELVRGGDSSFAVDYMVERILEEDAIYAEPTQEVIEKVDDLANYKSPEDADEYIWEWLDGLAEEKGTFVYTLMFDQIWVSDGSGYDLYDFDEDDKEEIKFAGTPLEEKQTLSETHIKREFFENLVDRFANEGYTYYPLDRYAVDFSRISIFLWLEQQAGDNVKAFTFVTTKKASGDVTGISIYSMPGERYYYFDNATEEDVDLIAGSGQLNESVKGWDKDVDFSNPEDLADALVKAEASFIDPGFFYEEIAIDVDRADDDADYEDIYYEALAQALFDAYGDDKLHYTFYYDDPSNNYIMLFSDGEYAYIEDSYNWTEDDYEMITGAGMLNENKTPLQHLKSLSTRSGYELADTLADIGAHYVELPDSDIAYLEDLDYEERDEEIYKILDEILSKSDHEVIFTYFPYDETFNIATATFNEIFYLNDFDDVFGQEAIDLVTGAGQLNEVIIEAWDDGIEWGMGQDVEEAADRLVEIGAKFIYFDFDPGELNQTRALYYFEDVADLMSEKYGMEDTLYYSFEDFHDGNELHKAFVFSDGDHVDVSNWDESDIELVKGAGELLEESLADKPTYVKIEALANDVVEQDLQYYQLSNDEREDLIELAAMIGDGEEPIAKWDKTIINILKKQRNKTGKEHYTITPTMTQIQYPEEQVIDYMYFDEFLTRFLPNADKSDLELLRGAGQLNEIKSPKDKFGNWWSEVDWNSPSKHEELADVLASLGAEYMPEEKWNTRDKDKYLDNGDLDGYISDVAYDFKIHSYDKPRLTFSLVEIGDEVHLISSTEFTYDMWDFSADDIELIIGAGQLNEYDTNWDEDLDFNTETSAEDIANRLANMGAKYVEVTTDIEPEEEYHESFGDYLNKMAELFSEKYGHEEELYFTYYVDDDAFIFSDGTYWFDEAGFLSDDVDLIIGAGQLNENKTLTEDEYPDPESAEDIADFLVNKKATFHELTSDEIDVIEDAWSRSGQEAGYQTTKDILKKHKEAGRPVFTYDEGSGGVFYILFNDGTGGAYYLEGFEDMEEPEAYDMIVNAGNLYEEEKKYVDPLASITDSSSGLQFADALAEAGARYVDGEWLDKIEYKYENNKYSDRGREYSDDILEELRNEFKKGDTLIFTYFQPERIFITWDGKYYDSFYMDEFIDVSGTADVRMIIDAGMLNEAIDLEDNKIGDMIDAYTYDIYSLIDPMGANQGNYQELSSGYMYKYGDSQNPADYYMENSWNTDLPKPIAETFEGLIESSFIKERALDYARDEFLGKHQEIEREFYGMQDELDPEILRDAGYDELADELENDIKEQEAAFLEDDYEIRFGSAINTNFDRDPESIYVHIYCQIYEFSDAIILKEVDLGVAYNNIKTVEDFRNAMKDFMTEKISAFLNGEPPAEINSDEEVGESKKPLNENANFENLVDNITKFPLHYVDLEDSLEKDMISYIQTSGMLDRRDDYEIDEYIWRTVSDYLEKLDRKAGFIDSEGRPETDEGFFTMLGSDFWGELGYFVNDDQWNVYTSVGLYDTYTLTKDEVQDVIEAGQIYDNPLKEQEEETEYNPTFEQIDEMIENATEELIYQVGRSFDGYGDPGVERLESGDGAIRYADGGFKSHETQNISYLYGNSRMPTKEANDAIENIYDNVYEYASEAAVKDLQRSHPEVYAEFAGDPEILNYKELIDASEAYEDVDPERSKMYYGAAEELDQMTTDAMYEDDDALIFFEVEIQYKKADFPDGDYVDPELTFRGEVSTQYKILAAKEVTKTFTSEEELEKALEQGTKEIEDWFDGSEYDKEVSEISEEVSFEDSERVYDDLIQHARNTIDLANPHEIEDIDKESYLSYFMGENYYIDMMEYMNGNFELPPDFEKTVIFDIDDRMYETSEDAVMNDIEDYIPKERSAEFAAIQDELVELYKSGELEDIDEDLYYEIKQAVDDKYGEYQDTTGVMRSFELFIDREEEKIQLIAKIDIDPEYDNIEEKKDVELSFSEVDKAKEIIQNMANWLNGDVYL